MGFTTCFTLVTVPFFVSSLSSVVVVDLVFFVTLVIASRLSFLILSDFRLLLPSLSVLCLLLHASLLGRYELLHHRPLTLDLRTYPRPLPRGFSFSSTFSSDIGSRLPPALIGGVVCHLFAFVTPPQASPVVFTHPGHMPGLSTEVTIYRLHRRWFCRHLWSCWFATHVGFRLQHHFHLLNELPIIRLLMVQPEGGLQHSAILRYRFVKCPATMRFRQFFDVRVTIVTHNDVETSIEGGGRFSSRILDKCGELSQYWTCCIRRLTLFHQLNTVHKCLNYHQVYYLRVI